MNLQQRIQLYMKDTGLSRTAVERYRTQSWGRFRAPVERKIATILQTLEGAAASESLTQAEFRFAAREFLRPVRAFCQGRLTTLEALIREVSAAFQRILARFRRAAVAVAPALPTLLSPR